MQAKTDAPASAHGGVWGARALVIALFGGFIGLGAEAMAQAHAVNPATLEQRAERTLAPLDLPVQQAPRPVERLAWSGVDIKADHAMTD